MQVFFMLCCTDFILYGIEHYIKYYYTIPKALELNKNIRYIRIYICRVGHYSIRYDEEKVYGMYSLKF